MTSQETGPHWFSWWPVVLGIVAILAFLRLPDPRLRRPRLRRWSWSPMMGLFLFVAALLAGILGAGIGGLLSGEQLGDPAPLNLRTALFLMTGTFVGQGVVFLLVPGLVIGRTRALESKRQPVNWCRAVLSGLGGLILAWPMVLAAAFLVGLLITLVTSEVLPEISHGMLLQLQAAAAQPDAWFIAVLALIVIVTPVWEEVLYRGILQEAIRRHPLLSGESPWLAIIITSLVFAVMHGAVMDLRGLVGIFVLSLGFGWVYLKTGRLLASIVMHAAFNVGNLLQVLL